MKVMDRRAFALRITAPAMFSITRVLRADVSNVWGEVPRWMELACVPGSVAAVIENGQVEAIHPFGVLRAGGESAVGPDTIFEAASLSKPVFASALLGLVKKKQLDLDRPVEQILPLTSDPRAKTITARQLLSHSSGLQNWRNPRNDKFEFAFPPGEKFSYSGEGYFHLQRVLEKITQVPFARYMREQVFAPLGMTRSSYIWREDPNSACPHEYRGVPRNQFRATSGRKLQALALEGKKPMEDWFYEDTERAMPRIDQPALPDYMQPNAAATLMTTAADYAKFLVHSFALDAMREPQIRINRDLSWGLGCGLETSGNRQWFWHWGDNPGFKNFFIADAGSRSGLLVFTNGDGGAKLYQRIIANALGRDFSAFLWA